MDSKDLILPKWSEYEPQALDYCSNADRQDLLCRFKLLQIYQNFCIARTNCIFSNQNTNYGELDPEGNNKGWLEKLFLQNAMIYYNFCIDLSWQMVYFYCITKSDEKFNITEEEIKKIENDITLESLQELLKCQLSLKKENSNLQRLLELITEFWNNKLPGNFREDYNYIKHRGALAIFENIRGDSNLPIEFKGHQIDIFIPKLKKLDLSQYTSMLKNFHQLFYEYIEEIIKITISPNLGTSKVTVKEFLENIINNSTRE